MQNWNGFVLCQRKWAKTPFPRTRFPGWFQVRLTRRHLYKLCKVEVKQMLCLCSADWCRVRHARSSYPASLPWGLRQLLQPLPDHLLQLLYILSLDVRTLVKGVSIYRRSPTSSRLVGDNVSSCLFWLSPHHIHLSFLIPCPLTSVPGLDTEVTVLHKLLNQLPQLLFTFL